MNLTAGIVNGYIFKISDGVAPSNVDIKISNSTSLALIQEINNDLINGVTKRFKLVGSKIVEEPLQINSYINASLVDQVAMLTEIILEQDERLYQLEKGGE